MVRKESWKKWFRRDNLLILVLSGVLLFIIALPMDNEEAAEQAVTGAEKTVQEQRDESEETEFSKMLETQLEDLLTEMAGVGKVKVMITLKSSEELIVEKDEPISRSNTNETDAAGGSRIIIQSESTETTVYSTNGSASEPYVIKTLSPRIEGVVVVAQGAGDGTVNQSITELVQALFDVEAHKVKVVKMASAR